VSELWTEFINSIQQVLGLSTSAIERLVWTLIVWLAFFLLRLASSFVIDRRVKDVARNYLLRKSTNYFFGFALIVITFVIWFGNLTGWAAYLGILSAGLAIALQDTITNIAGWIFITVRKPFTVGDRVQIGEHRGDVIDVRLFQFTLVEVGNWVDADQSTGRIIHIPNGWVFKKSTANYTRGFNFIWNELAITLTFESNWEKGKKILSEIAAKHSILKTQEVQNQVRNAAKKYLIFFEHLTPIVWTSVADNGVTLTIRYVCDPRKRRSSEGAIWEEVLRAFGANDDIDFAYPTTRFYDNVSEGKPEARAKPLDHD
jgi:small-conductance mechanosensitive channel